MKLLSSLFLIAIIFLGITFAVLNPDKVVIHYYIGQSKVPLSFLATVIFIIGCFFGLLVGFWLLLKARIKIFCLNHRLKLAEKEIDNLRAIPLRDKH